MKLIKEGTGQKGWAKEFECTGAGNKDGGCHAVLLVEHADLFITESSSYDGSTDSYTTFKCCQCGVLTDITRYNGPKVTRKDE